MTTSGISVISQALRDELTVRIQRTADDQSQWVGRLRRIGSTKLRCWGMRCLVDNAGLLISELVTNALRYGTGADILFRIALTDSVVLIEVDDGSASRPRVRHPGWDEENGRGMLLVEALADAWGIGATGTSVWCALSTQCGEQT